MAHRLTTAAALGIALLAGLGLGGCAADTLQLPTVSPMSASEIETQAQLDLEGNRALYLSKYPELTAPVVTRVRFISSDEWSTVTAECLTDLGYPTVAAADGGIAATPPTGQERSYALASYTCSAKYPIDPHETRGLNDEQLRYLYEYFTQVAIPCMKEQGYEYVGSTPSQQTYIDTYRTKDEWTPYFDAGSNATPEQWTLIEKACPQTPPGLFG